MADGRRLQAGIRKDWEEQFNTAIEEGLRIGVSCRDMIKMLEEKEGARQMIKAMNLTKKFDDLVAVDHINAEIKSGSVFGLIGTNGAGKSTFLRLAAGILKADEGHVTIDGEEVFENIKAKKSFSIYLTIFQQCLLS